MMLIVSRIKKMQIITLAIKQPDIQIILVDLIPKETKTINIPILIIARITPNISSKNNTDKNNKDAVNLYIIRFIKLFIPPPPNH